MEKALEQAAPSHSIEEQFPLRGPACVVSANDLARVELASVLRRMGHKTHEATSGVLATYIANEIRLSVLVVDMLLPDICGLKVIQRVRESAPNAVIIAVSSASSARAPMFTELALHAGADAAFAAPLSASTLCASLSAH